MADVSSTHPSVDCSKIDFASLPIYADNAAAAAGGLAVNDIYRTAAGALRVVVV